MTARIALVTGGTGGIGSAIVRRLAGLGHKVATNYRDEAKAHAWQANMKAHGVDAVIVPGDVA
ncbi:MAG TPA: SDR family NAD(P)-dependent oxidoreductase, partial [Rudaea sp.]|nr:SDR family NAD(P)-dependent oxidoreductase [Rudaea sp.]